MMYIIYPIKILTDGSFLELKKASGVDYDD